MRPADAPARAGLLGRVAVIGVVVVAALVGAPDPVLRVGVIVSLALAADQLARRRRRGVLDAVVLAAGALLTGLVLLGLVTGGPLGFSTRAWTAGFSLAALLALGAAVRRPGVAAGAEAPRHERHAWHDSLRAAPWVAASLVVVAVAIGTAGRSAERAVPAGAAAAGLSMSFGAVSGTTVDVVVTPAAGQPAPGPHALRVTVGTTEITYPVFTPTPGQPHMSRVSVPMTGRFVVDLVDPESGTVARTLMIAR